MFLGCQRSGPAARTPKHLLVHQLEVGSRLIAEITLVHNLARAGIAAGDPDFKAFEDLTPMIDDIEKMQDEYRKLQSAKAKNENEALSNERQLEQLARTIVKHVDEFLDCIDPANRNNAVTNIPRDLSTKLRENLVR